MAYYVVRQTKFRYEITKFEDKREPTDTYTIDSSRCFCPARIKSCKHMKIFKKWTKDKKPLGIVYDDSANTVGRMFT